jgi:hypothetical protein
LDFPLHFLLFPVLREMGVTSASTIFVPSTPNSVNHMTEQIRDAMLMSNAAGGRGPAAHPARRAGNIDQLN